MMFLHLSLKKTHRLMVTDDRFAIPDYAEWMPELEWRRMLRGCFTNG
jgi:hypothetical protein